MDAVANNELEVKVRAPEAKMMRGVDGIGKGRPILITKGLCCSAALIIGAALLMRIDTAWRLFGYPGLAILCFAAAIGRLACHHIAVEDHRSRKNRPH